MSFVQSSLASEQRGPFAAEPTRSPLDLRPVLGMGLVGLGIGMFCLGVFHGFAHGSCSTTGYSGNYGRVPRCSNGVGWWMLMLMVGLVVAGGGAVIARSIGSLIVPLVFVAIGAPFIALAFGNHGRLVLNASSGTGKIYAGVFGACFVIAGLIWGAFAARKITGVGGASLLCGVIAAAVGVGAAFAVAAGVSSAIGKTTAPSSVQVAPGVTVLSAAAERAHQISLCKDLVAGQRLVGARERAVLTSQCNADRTAAERQAAAAERRAAVAYATAQCGHSVSVTGLPASARSTLEAACKNPAKSSSGTGLKSLQAQLCEQIVKAQVPVAEEQQALARCPKS